MRNEPLATERLSLEPWSAAHVDLLGHLAAQPEVTRFIGTGTPWTPEHTAEVAARCLQHWRRHGFGWRVAVQRDTGASLGFIALNFAGEGAGIAADEYEIGWWLEPPAWGRGLAREGAEAICHEAFERISAPSLVARIAPANAASLGVAGAIGMVPEGQGQGRFGEPIAILRLTATTWRTRSEQGQPG
ncbi:MAG: GNAT family N-acetyltransferase [Solirubrobacteraceae bacterium]